MGKALLVALLLSAEEGGKKSPDFHVGGAITFGIGAPFQNVNAGFQFGFKAVIDFAFIDKVTLGAVLPVAFGFYNGGTNLVATSYQMVDFMPGLRGTYAIIEWVYAVFELGLGPSVFTARAEVPFFGTTASSSTSFAMRGTLSIELVPKALSGVMFVIEPLAIHGRVGSSTTTFSEYRFSLGAGYRY